MCFFNLPLHAKLALQTWHLKGFFHELIIHICLIKSFVKSLKHKCSIEGSFFPTSMIETYFFMSNICVKLRKFSAFRSFFFMNHCILSSSVLQYKSDHKHCIWNIFFFMNWCYMKIQYATFSKVRPQILHLKAYSFHEL